MKKVFKEIEEEIEKEGKLGIEDIKIIPGATIRFFKKNPRYLLRLIWGLFLLALPFVLFMFLWNQLMPPIFGLSEISFIQAIMFLLLLLLIRIFLFGFRKKSKK